MIITCISDYCKNYNTVVYNCNNKNALRLSTAVDLLCYKIFFIFLSQKCNFKAQFTLKTTEFWSFIYILILLNHLNVTLYLYL